MKTSAARLLTANLMLALGFVSLLAGCSRHDRAEAETKTKEAYEQTKAAVANAWDRVKSYSFKDRDKFAAHAKELAARADAQMTELRTKAADANASERRRAAMAELKDANADYQQKVGALGNASAATWNSAKENVILAWDRLELAYYEARAGK